MEVYNHWGAVDENIQLPEHVISQFFTTRASYYDPSKKVHSLFLMLEGQNSIINSLSLAFTPKMQSRTASLLKLCLAGNIL